MANENTDKQPQKVRITWRETPDAGFGKPRSVNEVRMARDAADLHEQFWGDPSWTPATTRKVEIIEVEWLEA